MLSDKHTCFHLFETHPGEFSTQVNEEPFTSKALTTFIISPNVIFSGVKRNIALLFQWLLYILVAAVNDCLIDQLPVA